MSEYQPLSSVRELDVLDDDDCVAGYLAGLDGAHHRGVGGLGRGGDLHRGMLQHHLAVVVDIADHRPQPGGELVRPGAIAFAEQIDFTLLFFYRAFHLASAGIGLPAICDCTWATIRDSAA